MGQTNKLTKTFLCPGKRTRDICNNIDLAIDMYIISPSVVLDVHLPLFSDSVLATKGTLLYVKMKPIA